MMMSCDDWKCVIGKVVLVVVDCFVIEMYVGIDNFIVVGFDDVYYVVRFGLFLMVVV